MTRVKVCGITREEDLLAAATAGADAVGFVFHPKSPRYVTPERAAALARVAPPFVTLVGLFVNAGADVIRRVMAVCPLDLVQLHGDETIEHCRELQPLRVIKAVRVASAVDLAGLERYPVSGLLLDAKVGDGRYGGTGQAFDWEVLAGWQAPCPVILAGGLHPGNVAAAICRVRPHAVDVSSGVESVPGIKDAVGIRAFMAAVRDSIE